MSETLERGSVAGDGRGDGPRRADPFVAPGSLPGGGMTGGVPADVYKPPHEPDDHTVAPDGRPAESQPRWRQDFPIDWPQDHYVSRRDFTKFMVLTSLAFFAGQVWIVAKNALRKGRGEAPVRRIASLAQVPVGGTITFAYPGPNDPCILVRKEKDVLFAYGQKCTHLSCAVVPRPEENTIVCPCHHGIFDLPTGRPIAGPPRRPLPRILLEVRGGEIYATGVERRTV